jgi:hypothetical protein
MRRARRGAGAEDAAYSEMPQTALRRSNVDRVARLPDMPTVLQRLVQEPAGEPTPRREEDGAVGGGLT